MEHIQNFFKFKNLKNIFMITIAVIFAAIISLIIGLKLSFPYRPSFFNYKSYVSKANEDRINQTFDYKEFNEIDEFTVALNNNKAIAGIGSDFQVVDLIKRGFIQKINFEKLLDLKEPIKTKDELKAILQKIYTPTVFKHLESYDVELTTDANGNVYNEPLHIWEYFVPYFHQDGVVAINPLKNTKTPIDDFHQKLKDNYKELSKTTTITNFTKQTKYNSLINILNTTHKNGYENLLITDAVRVNMLYGSPYNVQNNKLKSNYGQITTNENYQEIVNSFLNLIKLATNHSIESKIFSFNGDGLEVLRTLLDVSINDVNAALMFNGDALDAYYSEDNELQTINKEGKSIPIPNGTIEVIKFHENILLVDGLVVANKITKQTEDILYKTLRESIYANIEAPYKSNGATTIIRNIYDEYLNVAFRDKFINAFNSLNLPNSHSETAFNEFKTKLIELYASNLNKELDDTNLTKFNDFVAKKLTDDPNYKTIFQALVKLEENHTQEDLIAKVAFGFSHIDFDSEAFSQLLLEKYQNLENFAFVNYTPSNIAEYELVRRNYFVKDDNTYDEKAINIYEVKDQEGVISHKRISGVSEKLNSLLNTYYYLKIKH
ncbi:hypothetical protein [Mycoplasmopsis bovirhinis]|uniref:Uncharacterized protein n=1 Tax=Mycoplasmopsis bovirhinis TaxID=29553 RepID=A0A449ACG3_9BACT|nr:hypothetical protein [Mycoplasmopsis bovirhinis]VEU62677.1 Uncharacterised protein [Mycoplasmopsis bovirhinis]